jgi:hypothetical protein
MRLHGFRSTSASRAGVRSQIASQPSPSMSHKDSDMRRVPRDQDSDDIFSVVTSTTKMVEIMMATYRQSTYSRSRSTEYRHRSTRKSRISHSISLFIFLSWIPCFKTDTLSDLKTHVDQVGCDLSSSYDRAARYLPTRHKEHNRIVRRN